MEAAKTLNTAVKEFGATPSCSKIGCQVAKGPLHALATRVGQAEEAFKSLTPGL